MAKTPYEIRLEVLQIAKEQSQQEHFHKWQLAAKKAEISEDIRYLVEVPEFPTTETILLEAEKLKKFIDNNE